MRFEATSSQLKALSQVKKACALISSQSATPEPRRLPGLRFKSCVKESNGLERVTVYFGTYGNKQGS